ncbi:MAG: hypothetical protein WDA20_12755 [Desulfuromonadales bacterium]|jgi:hypothetical protein
MKNTSLWMTLALALAATPAWAVDTAKVYSSGLLIAVFVGVCALLVISQMIPALLLLLGMIKAMASNVFRGKVAAEPAKK